ncbi:MAG: hypothetical protein J0G32_02870 [Alphaproteobacteria bacterium]|nr:hypothetical protein [Alphaproteobacteria bacterium]OJV15324.1 MAG: hypothetical protein BGO27_02315 [Alphaproteobacteria bacterium 33-17]
MRNKYNLKLNNPKKLLVYSKEPQNILMTLQKSQATKVLSFQCSLLSNDNDITSSDKVITINDAFRKLDSLISQNSPDYNAIILYPLNEIQIAIFDEIMIREFSIYDYDNGIKVLLEELLQKLQSIIHKGISVIMLHKIEQGHHNSLFDEDYIHIPQQYSQMSNINSQIRETLLVWFKNIVIE